MVSNTRESYHHGNLREALIAAGLELARDGGARALTLRDATRRAAVSPSAAYRHFADRDALIAAVASRIRERMTARMASFAGTATSGRDRLRAVGLGYIAFAREEPGWFETAFAVIDALPSGADPSSETAPGDVSAPPAPLAALSAALDALVAEGSLPADRRAGAEWPCWSAVHGFARLVLRGPLRRLPAADVDAAALRTVDTVIAGLLVEPAARSARR